MLFAIFFCLAILSDYIILNKINNKQIKYYYICFRNISFFKMKFIIFIIILPVFYIFNIGSWFGFNICDYMDIHFNISDDKGNLDIGKNSNVNVTINDPKGTVNVNGKAISHVASAISSAGGATVAYKAAKHIPGTPITKLAAGIGVMTGVQTTTYVMSKILNNGNNNGHNFIYSLADSYGSDNILNNYPLNLLPGIDGLFYVSLLFLSIILNIYIARYIISINILKDIPDNYFGKILKRILERYIKIWSKTSKFLLAFSYGWILWCLSLSKLCIYIILNDNSIDFSFNNYPLDILIWVNILLNGALLLLCIILIIYIARYLINKNYTKYIPSIYIDIIIKNILNWYVKELYNTKISKFLLILNYIILLMLIILGKFCITVVINFYT